MTHADNAVANRLAAESSPYLLQHAYNPVEWYPWGEEAFAVAAKQDKPILLSVGYSACHWCHVMERESFENAAIADQMNASFICIKVDREERPDVDAIYMNSVQLMTGQGGWPMTVFLTPDGKPFYGGTYYPPTDLYGRPGFPRVLEAVSSAWTAQRNDIELQGAEMLATMNQSIGVMTDDSAGDPGQSVISTALKALAGMFDQTNGGFGSSPKFPQPANIDLLLRAANKNKNGHSKELEMAELTLQKMALGGIYDQLGGGFHRYSTDAIWLAPHFEKMLYDNAQLASTYCRAYQLTGKQFYRDIAEETLEYVLREMTDPETGAFYSAQDADSEGEEGRFFVWTPEQLSDSLGTERDAAIFASFYDVSSTGNWEGANILRVVKDASMVAVEFNMSVAEVVQILDRARTTLLAARENRIKPGLDDKSLTSWNALMLQAFALCGAAFQRSDFLDAATKNAEFIDRHMSFEKDGKLRLLRTSRHGVAKLNGYLEDYSFAADAYIELYQSTGARHWLTQATCLVDSIETLFVDTLGVGFYSTSLDHEVLVQRLKDWDDNAIPSGNSVALEAILKLAYYHGDGDKIAKVKYNLGKLAGVMEKHPYGFARLLANLDRLLDGAVEIAIVGDISSKESQELVQIIHSRYMPNLILAFGGAASDLSGDLELLYNRPIAADGKTTVYVCRNNVCSRPITTAEELEQSLNQ